MRISRLYIQSGLQPGLALDLPEQPSHYLAKVLRLNPGDSIQVFNSSDGEFTATVERVSRKQVNLLVGQQRRAPEQPALCVHLGVGLSRGDRMDYLIQKATELGVMSISPLLTEFGEVRFRQEKRLDNKLRHWRAVAISACEQSGRVSVPVITEPRPIDEWLTSVEADTRIILQPDGNTRLASLEAVDSLCVLSGPEGGFSDSEVDRALAAGFLKTAMGPRILRTETAPVAALAILQSRFGDI